MFYSHTSTVPARVGIRFGTRFRVVGTPANQTTKLRSVWRFPEPGLRKPQTGTLYRQSIADTAAMIGAQGMRGYTFDAAWEILCGEWIQEVWFGERKLLSRTFTVEGCEGRPISARELGRCAGNPRGPAACRAG